VEHGTTFSCRWKWLHPPSTPPPPPQAHMQILATSPLSLSWFLFSFGLQVEALSVLASKGWAGGASLLVLVLRPPQVSDETEPDVAGSPSYRSRTRKKQAGKVRRPSFSLVSNSEPEIITISSSVCRRKQLLSMKEIKAYSK
jgi:hypothetical protein